MERGARVRLTGHLPGLDGVRGLAILLVMAVHFVGDASAQTLGQRLVVKAASYGVLGVDLFFVLSGFLITGLLVDAKDGPNYFRNFYARRTLRIFPLYYLVLALLFIVLPFAWPLSPALEEARAHQAWLWTYTANFYIAARASWALTYVSHFWSLAIEEHFYLFWPLVVFSFQRRTLERICGAVIGAGLLLRVGLALGGMSELSISVLTPCRIDTLCVGALLALLCRRDGWADEMVRRSGRAALALASVTIALSAWCAVAKTGLPVLHQIRGTLYALFFGTLVLISLQPQPSLLARVLRGGALRFFGKYSYGLYVYHGLLTWFFIEFHTEARFDAFFGNHAIAIAAKAACGVALSVAVAMASYELFEKPFLSLKRFFEVREPASPRPAGAGAVPAAGAGD
ncbi:MAG TPA: acyltransferase [Myxococcales bacterium]|nr:acyltransferase [Myxococcales bacterium]